LFWDTGCGSVPVVDAAGVLQGMLTDRDICMAAYTPGRRLPDIRVQIAMSRCAHAVTDINLPGMSGYEAARRLQAWPETRDIPVIALTAAAMLGDRKRLEQAGFARYLTKPAKVAELLAALEELLTPRST
jgi:CheY-like chemotaxis protein